MREWKTGGRVWSSFSFKFCLFEEGGGDGLHAARRCGGKRDRVVYAKALNLLFPFRCLGRQVDPFLRPALSPSKNVRRRRLLARPGRQRGYQLVHVALVRGPSACPADRAA